MMASGFHQRSLVVLGIERFTLILHIMSQKHAKNRAEMVYKILQNKDGTLNYHQLVQTLKATMRIFGTCFISLINL